jgi:hypothetical protein
MYKRKGPATIYPMTSENCKQTQRILASLRPSVLLSNRSVDPPCRTDSHVLHLVTLLSEAEEGS